MSVWVLVQVPLQTVVVPAGHWQIPETQAWPPEQTWPQVPQLFWLRSRSKQLPLQEVWPEGQAAWH